MLTWAMFPHRPHQPLGPRGELTQEHTHCAATTKPSWQQGSSLQPAAPSSLQAPARRDQVGKGRRCRRRGRCVISSAACTLSAACDWGEAGL